jgi:hypothetical protein
MEEEHLNPSFLEVQFAEALYQLKDQIGELILGNKITYVKKFTDLDNPKLHFTLENEKGKELEVVVKIIQRANTEIGNI